MQDSRKEDAMAARRAKSRPRRRRRKSTKDKTIWLILEPNDDDITEKPSCCHVKPGWTVTFKSKPAYLNFTVGFNSVCGSPFVQRGTKFSGTGSATPLGVDVTAARKKFKYAVMLTDPRTKETYCDCDCPTIIVGELRGKEGSDDDS